MHFLITGSNGLLGQKIVRQLLKSEHTFIATSFGENRNPDCPSEFYLTMDITKEEEVRRVISTVNPLVVINTAAMTNVDSCEENEEKCRQINVFAVNFLMKACQEVKAHFVHLSTDFVFDGESGPYKEEDERNPLSIYAVSKRDSEDLLMNQVGFTSWSILRTIIVFGEGNNLSRSNIVLWGKSALEKGDPLTIVNDQFRAPTWADDLAWACIQAGIQRAKGVYHISGPETFSIYELVCRIAQFYGYAYDQVKPISSATLNQKAKRPPKTGFVIEKASQILGYSPQSFEKSLSKLT